MNEPIQKTVFHDKTGLQGYILPDSTIQQSFGVDEIPGGKERNKSPNQEIMDSAGILTLPLVSSRQSKPVMKWLSDLTVCF